MVHKMNWIVFTGFGLVAFNCLKYMLSIATTTYRQVTYSVFNLGSSKYCLNSGEPMTLKWDPLGVLVCN